MFNNDNKYQLSCLGRVSQTCKYLSESRKLLNYRLVKETGFGFEYICLVTSLATFSVNMLLGAVTGIVSMWTLAVLIKLVVSYWFPYNVDSSKTCGAFKDKCPFVLGSTYHTYLFLFKFWNVLVEQEASQGNERIDRAPRFIAVTGTTAMDWCVAYQISFKRTIDNIALEKKTYLVFFKLVLFPRISPWWWMRVVLSKRCTPSVNPQVFPNTALGRAMAAR